MFTLGDRPEARWDEARQWLDERGYDSTLDYVRAMAIRVLEETGLLPHLNPGVMSWSELSRLKPVAPSMGMMLETTSRRLFETKGLAHYGSPDKDPEVRLRTLADAGRLSIPFTTGLLVGIGETLAERAETMHAIRRSHKEFGHVQEVIVQNFRAKDHTAMAAVPDAGHRRLPRDGGRHPAGARARRCASRRRRTWCRAHECLALIGAGVDDWGGVSPLTPDHVNPERPWPALDELAAVTAEAGYDLVQRLTAQPQYVQAGAAWIDPRVRGHVAALADPDTGLRAATSTRSGRPWQEPDEATGVAGPHRPAHRDRHRGPADRDAQRSGQRVRRLGVDPREGARAGRPRTRAGRHRRARGAALGRARPGRLHRRRVSGAGHRRRSGTGCRCGAC